MRALKNFEFLKDVIDNGEFGEIVDGVYSSVHYTLCNGQVFDIIADHKDVNGVRVGSVVLKNGKEYRGSSCSGNGCYNSLCIGGWTIDEHKLLLAILVPGVYEQMLRNPELVINHKTIHDDVDKKNYYNDVRDLELVTRSENAKHGFFIRTFDLFDISISAKDIDELKSIIIDKSRVSRVINCYKSHGIEFTKSVANML
jgi:hypothetical protein